MTTRRMTSRKVALTAAFLALAAGGTAACDASPDEEVEYSSGYDEGSSGARLPDADEVVNGDADEESTAAAQRGDEVFYCADEDGEIVDEDECDDGGTSSSFLWHSTGYDRGLRPGTQLDGGDYFLPGDRAARRAFKLPKTGRVRNGTVKTNVVGRSSGSGSTGTSGSTSGSGSTSRSGSTSGSGSIGGSGSDGGSDRSGSSGFIGSSGG